MRKVIISLLAVLLLAGVAFGQPGGRVIRLPAGVEVLTDPGADRLWFWDESQNKVVWLSGPENSAAREYGRPLLREGPTPSPETGSAWHFR